MKSHWKDLLTFMNTAFIAGLIFYTQYKDSGGAIICSLAIFVATLTVSLLLQPLWKNKSKKR